MSSPSTGVALPEGVLSLVAGYLGRQRWFSGEQAPDPTALRVVDADQLARANGGSSRLLWAIVAVRSDAPDTPGASDDGAAEIRYQLLIGERPNGEPAEFLNGHEPSVLGSVGDRYYYDATVDPVLALAWLNVITDGSVTAEWVRPVNVEQSNTSLVFDNRLIAKMFRRLLDGPNPDVEVTEALARVGFSHVAQPAAVWRKDGTDLAFVQQFLAGGTEGWALALTSLRDLYSYRPDDPADAGGDFAHEACRLGHMTAEMHLAMAEAFGIDLEQFPAAGWPAVVAEIENGLRAQLGEGFSGPAEQILDRLRAVSDPGPAIRVHGDYHLGQVMRTDDGWFVLDFEGEPARDMSERLAFRSPFKDVTGMLRSFHYAAHFALLEQEEHVQEELGALADWWESHNRQAFLDGYFATPGIAALLPDQREVGEVVSLAFELQKAVYELAYERAYRPDWIPIPSAAIGRMLAGSYRGLNG
ncbi:MAG: phosphotransferase [Actinomycetota bacterium]|nr:phosphotransferase [Actinomycetota bacterium]